jgi:SAM-dependent methyltransferase
MIIQLPKTMFYHIDFRCDDEEELQGVLNRLYDYQDDLGTKILHRNRMNLFYLLLETLIRQKVVQAFDSALDIGCNAGAYSKILSDFGCKYVLGIDIDAKTIQKAHNHFACTQKNRVVEFKVLDAEMFETSKKFDFILCTEVIEHTDHPHKIIENIKNLLAPRGIAIITLPNRLSIPYVSRLWFYKMRRKPLDAVFEQHLKYPFYKSIRLFTSKHFQVIKTDGTNLVLNRAILRVLYRRSIFPMINELNFHLSRLWPLKYFSQFFFLTLQVKSSSTVSKGRS